MPNVFKQNSPLMKKINLIACLLVLSLVACRNTGRQQALATEDFAAKQRLQGVWIDSETQEVNFKISGDTIFYPDSTSQPATFKVVADTLVIGNPPSRYPLVKLLNNVFVFKNQNGEEVKLMKSDSPDDDFAFEKRSAVVEVVNKIVKKDTVIQYGSERYHCYVTVNPTKYKVLRRTFNDDGVAVNNVYFDNIIHICVYNGAEKLYSSDLKKQMYEKYVPKDFLEQSVLGDVRVGKIDSQGVHFETIIGIPEETTNYILDTRVSLDGKMKVFLNEE